MIELGPNLLFLFYFHFCLPCKWLLWFTLAKDFSNSNLEYQILRVFFLIIHLFLIQILFSPLFETHQSSWSLKLSHIKEYITSGFDMFCCNNCLINDREKHSEQEFLPQDDFIYSYNFIIKHFFIIWFNKVTENRKNKFLIFSFI